MADEADRAIEQGFTEMSMGFPFREEQLHVLERIATEVLPHLRR